MQKTGWTSDMLDALPDNDGNRYEIIDGELYVAKQPGWIHQHLCIRIGSLLDVWCVQTGQGIVSTAPGIIFSEDNDVAPDLVWISNARSAALSGKGGHYYGAPELVIEVLSPGSINERRDRVAKRALYGRRGVEEYWIVDWRKKQIEVYRRDVAKDSLELAATLGAGDTLHTPLLPGFSASLELIFRNVVDEGDDDERE